MRCDAMRSCKCTWGKEEDKMEPRSTIRTDTLRSRLKCNFGIYIVQVELPPISEL